MQRLALAYAAPRSTLQETQDFAPRQILGDAPRRAKAPTATGRGYALARRVATGLLMLALLTLTGVGAARVLDSHLLGFVFADLVFLVGVALRGAVSDSRRARRY